MEIVEKRRAGVRTWFERVFRFRDCPSSYYSFECSQHGQIDLFGMNPAARKNYEKCVAGEFDVIDEGIREREHHYDIPAVGKCSCGELVSLSGFTNTCECGADYNWNGDRLAHRSQWGEETGESACDILMGGDDFDY